VDKLGSGNKNVRSSPGVKFVLTLTPGGPDVQFPVVNPSKDNIPCWLLTNSVTWILGFLEEERMIF